MRKDGTFIAVEVDDAVASDAAVAAKLAEVCPVDIFAAARRRRRGDRREEPRRVRAVPAVPGRGCLGPPARAGAQALRGRRGAVGRRVHYLDGEPVNENFSLIVMCIFLLASLAFLAEQLTSYH